MPVDRYHDAIENMSEDDKQPLDTFLNKPFLSRMSTSRKDLVISM